MRIFPAEYSDGLADVILATASSTSPPIEPTLTPAQSDGESLAIASTNFGQKDLYYLKSVLVTVGFNGNGDVFLPDETWASRFTPVDKPSDMEHDRENLVGHTTDIAATGVSLDTPVDMSQDETPPEFVNLVDTSVIYLLRGTKERKAWVENFIKELVAGKWKVSMECGFDDFDYALHPGPIDRNVGMSSLDLAQATIVKRSAETAHLSKCLRFYNPKAKNICEVDGKTYYIGRVLRGITFAGKGFVRIPANPRSLVIETGETSVASVNDISQTTPNEQSEYRNLDTLGSLEVTKEQIDEAVAALNAATAELNTTKEELALAKAKASSLEEAVNKAALEIGTLKTLSETNANELVVAKAALETVVADRDTARAALELATTELDTFKVAAAETAKANRLTQVKEKLKVAHHIEDAKLEKLALTFANMTDADIDEYVATVGPKSTLPNLGSIPDTVETKTTTASDNTNPTKKSDAELLAIGLRSIFPVLQNKAK